MHEEARGGRRGTEQVKMGQRDQEERGYKKVGREEEDDRETEMREFI